MIQRSTNSFGKRVLGGMALVAAMASTGCQVDVGGQVHPSPFYLTDDVQYFAPGSEFLLPKEDAAISAYRANEQLQGR